MPQSTPSPIPESIEVSVSDAMTHSDAEWAKHRRAAICVLYTLTDCILKGDVSFHGCTPIDVFEGYGVCIHDVMSAAVFMARRGMIDFYVEPPPDESACRCVTCEAKRGWLSFRYDAGPDFAAVRAIREREAQAAIKHAELMALQERSIAKKRNQDGYVYLLRCGGRYKIGITSDLNRRLSQLRGQQPPFPIEVVNYVIGPDYARFERVLHEQYAEVRQHGEWFAFDADQLAAVIETMNEWQPVNSVPFEEIR